MLNALQAVRDYLEPAMVFPAITLLLLALFFIYYAKVSRPEAGTLEWVEREISKTQLTFALPRYKMGKKDALPLAVILALFAFLAFFVLGDTEAPQSFHQFTKEESEIIIELDSPEKIESIMYYTGLWTGRYTLDLSTNGVNWIRQDPLGYEDAVKESPTPSPLPSPAMNQSYAHLFKWRLAELNADNPAVKYIRLKASNYPMELGEIAIYGENGRIPATRLWCPEAPALLDEQELVPSRPEYMNSMYFDEIYHGRTALEHLRNIRPYETTHPPLGKEIIAVSISAFGMTPFGWRFPGALFGVIMLAILYIFIKNMFGKTAVATCGTLLLGFDFMRFVQTRIATIDTYGVFFILLSYYFMYRYITTAADAPFRKHIPPLALSGLFFGIGCASKWIVIYSGVGLAALYIIRLVMAAKQFDRYSIPGFRKLLVKTLSWSVLFFVIIPVAIYCLSYIPYGLAQGMEIGEGMLTNKDFYKIIWDNQKSMLSYHGKLIAEHPYSSWWYQWIVDGRPILYYNQYEGTVRSTFSAFGNPVIWWGGFVAMVVMVLRLVRQRDGKALFILIGYLSQLLPWVFISRIVFVYHYFPSTLFLVLAIAHLFNTILESKHSWRKASVYAYTAASGVVFGMFYPALTGVWTPQWYFKYLLRWIPGAWPI
ncbi:MAG: glycosyltransferase family 39 protein [Oscillospiraceae bacterium]|nr:glycosyltransferase family 39 protein [Oscillospiraceae bacterium]